MGFYFRKSFGSNLFRVNFSKSGISYSTGFKGARVNFSSRGTYVNFGSNGIYYRKKISDFENNSNRKVDNYRPPFSPELHTITSSNIEDITDIDSEEFINELTEKSNKISYFNWYGIPISIILSAILVYFFFNTPPSTVTITKSKLFVSSLSTSDLNIRRYPNKNAEVIGVFSMNEKFLITDTTNSNWYNIDFNGLSGFVYRHNKIIISEELVNETIPNKNVESYYEKHNFIFWVLLIILSILLFIFLNYLKNLDSQRLLVEIYYDLDEGVKEVYEKFISSFASILSCNRTWQYLHSQNTNDYKYTSGASSLVNRKPLNNLSVNKTPLNIFRTNVQVPYIGLINTELYFFPERLIIKRGNRFGAIMYKNISVDSSTTRFIETEGVPQDSNIVDTTWRYLNKNGTPDKRFSNNYQIPICLYSIYSFASFSGLNEIISTSKVGGFDDFIKLLRLFGGMQEKIKNYGGLDDISIK